MKNGIVRYVIVGNGVMEYGIMRYGIVRDVAVRDGVVRYGIVKYAMVSHNVLYPLTSSCSISIRIAGRSFPTSSSFRDCIFCSH